MKILDIKIELGKRGASGTRAICTVQRSRAIFWRANERRVYVCHQTGPLMGAKWVDKSTGMPLPEKFGLEVNMAAQAAARLAGVA